MAANSGSATIGSNARGVSAGGGGDAVVLDSTHLSEDEVLERIEKLWSSGWQLDAELAKRRIAASKSRSFAPLRMTTLEAGTSLRQAQGQDDNRS